jgi:hypothetical protein
MDEDSLNVGDDPVEGFINVEFNHGSPGYSASEAESIACGEHSEFDSAEGLPFRALDLVSTPPVFSRTAPEPLTGQVIDTDDLFGNALDFSHASNDAHEPVWEHVDEHSQQIASESSVQLCDELEPPVELGVQDEKGQDVTIPMGTWNELVASSFAQFQQTQSSLLFPWETGTMAAIFDFDKDPLPLCPGLAQPPLDQLASASNPLQEQLSRFALPGDAKYVHAVKSMRDMSYFEEKSQKRDLACGQWLHILAVDWSASGVGPQLAASLQNDFTGTEAFTILSACFGVKSPSTLLKRAGAMRQYLNWFERSPVCSELSCRPIPLQEAVIWEYFQFLKQRRIASASGYTVPSAFLEMVRFCKFTVDLVGTDEILASRRLLGFSALERQAKGPSKQAPPLEVAHLQRLHQVLQEAGNMTDRLGAGCFLVCVYGRARWSDLRYIDHIDVIAGDCMTLYTTEHKTASVGLRRDQYLPLVVPWEGICSGDWIPVFLDVYASCGLQWDKRPLGPLLPAPRVDGSFCARPLSTSEAAVWLRGLLQGTPEASSFRSHSLKATLLGWCARAGLDKETRAVLGHHCSALSGSEVVYSRQLQIRAIRKLCLILRRVRMGLGFEDAAMKEFGVISTPAPFTPAIAARTPVQQMTTMQVAFKTDEPVRDAEAVTQAVAAAVELEELQSVKEEQLDVQVLEQAADGISLFPLEVVSAGVVEIDSSTGSESDSSSSASYSSSTEEQEPEEKRARHIEEVPEGHEFFKHVKSGIVHSCATGQLVSQCKLTMSSNYKKLERRLFVNFPKCIRCFPKDHNRIRNVGQLTKSLDTFLKAKKAKAAE